MRALEQIVRSNAEVDTQFTIGRLKTRIQRLERALSDVVTHAREGAYAGDSLPADHPLLNAEHVLAEAA